MKKMKTIGALLVALTLCACASTQRLSDEDRARSKTITINNTVQKGAVFLLAPSGANIGLMFGAVGGAAASGSIASQQTTFENFLQAKSIKIETIVRDEFEKALRESGKVSIAAQADGTLPTLRISVPQYGFGVTHLLGSKVVPVLQIQGELLDSSGKLLWSESERMLPSIASPMDSTTWAELHDKPEQIEQEWRKAASYLARKIIANL